MYWLVGSLVIIAMMGVLAVADNVAMPIDMPLLNVVSATGLLWLLVIFAIILLSATQLNSPSVNTQSTNKTRSVSSPNDVKLSLFSKYFLFGLLAIGLVVGSALQALVAHQQAETTKITDSIRVQALVRIEGISDSVYDASTDSGYRQVAVVTHLMPLVAELTPQDLANSTSDYSKEENNSLSKSYNESSDKNLNNSIEYRVLLNAYPKNTSNDDSFSNLNDLQPGDELFMSLALVPLSTSKQAISNPSGFDSYRWLRGRHIDGVANILAVSPLTVSKSNNDEALQQASTSDSYFKRFRTRIDIGRWQLRDHFYRDWPAQTIAEQQARAVTLSLLTGDRSLINRDTKDLYQLAGISHLLAISGTHVLFLAIVLGGAVVLLFNRLCPVVYRDMPRWQVRWWVMIGAAFIYALFTGFDVPAARTAWMLLAIGLVRLTLLPISTMRVLLALAVLMAWQDPYVLWQAGYWLSFIAVALLLKYEGTLYQRNTAAPPLPYNDDNGRAYISNVLFRRALQIAQRIFKLQFWLFLTLLPITLLLFGKASLWGLIVNLFAIGLFGWVIVPLNLLAGLFYLLSPTIADSIWSLVSAIVGNLHELIGWLTSLPALTDAWLYTPVNMAILLMVLLSVVPWLLPRGLLSRWLALPPLTLLMMTVYANQQSMITMPTLYILPTGDPYISAALLKFPLHNQSVSNSKDGSSLAKDNTSWLFLADHRPTATRTMPSNLTADKLSVSLEQQLGSLSVDKLEGIIVQSSSTVLTDTLNASEQNMVVSAKNSELLPLAVAQLNQQLPVSQYWQAGRSERWSAFQQASKIAAQSKGKTNISAQGCEQGKTWQVASGDLSIQAMTGWSEIGDTSVWDCTIAIDSSVPIQVLRYNAADPLKSLSVNSQTKIADNQLDTDHKKYSLSRLVLDTDTHPRVWQMWSLLCSADSNNDSMRFKNITWLGHSASQMTTDVISRQSINDIITYDDKPLEASLSLNIINNGVDAEAMSP
ncbi:competence protein ComEC [Psychrobacter sp. C 20.9]|uniref:ComEC/Rec2 family competence protein n=1 Tax=Psychrobacter sp. C 20.9 TaxID=1926477 RepID=UPI000946FEF6|nr:ComEC/Rec2 family competence protein [Psychrobacter sp. C 20.9]OLF36563.1 competence protein ComEC [Psychrobacter sp. C 20.9]